MQETLNASSLCPVSCYISFGFWTGIARYAHFKKAHLNK